MIEVLTNGKMKGKLVQVDKMNYKNVKRKRKKKEKNDKKTYAKRVLEMMRFKKTFVHMSINVNTSLK